MAANNLLSSYCVRHALGPLHTVFYKLTTYIYICRFSNNVSITKKLLSDFKTFRQAAEYLRICLDSILWVFNPQEQLSLFN